jgi:hypothetical protein
MMASSQDDSAETIIDSLEDKVRACYIAVKRKVSGNLEYGKQGMERWDGGQDKNGRLHKPVWPKLAKHIVNLGADPAQYIQAQFNNARKDRLPLPNQLMSPRAVSCWERHTRDAPKALADRLEREMAAIFGSTRTLCDSLKWPLTRALRYSLLDVKGVAASVFVRYCCAVETGYDDIADTFRERAVVDYVFQRSLYDRVWSENIPASVKEEANAMVERL